MAVKVETTSSHVLVTSPFHPDFPREARRLGGKWNSPVWQFDVRDEQRVREMCQRIYGTDGTAAAGDLVTLRCRIAENRYWDAPRQGLYVAGRCVARATGRDSGAHLGDGVVLLEGTITSGGSMKNWNTIARGPVLLEIRDVPRPAALAAIADPPDSDLVIEIIEQGINREALLEEKRALEARIAEIDAALNA